MTETHVLPVLNDCWNRIGVKGDASCPELANVVHCHNCPVFAAAGQQLFQRAAPPECVEEWTQALAREEPVPACDTVASHPSGRKAPWMG